MAGTERYIENNVMRNRSQMGYGDSLYVRRCRVGRDFGIVDLMLLPLRGPHRLVLVEAKRFTSADAPSKVIGQLLLYYTGALHLGSRGVRHLKQFASTQETRARSTSRTSLKTLTGGISPPEDAWAEMQKGRKLKPKQIGLYIALDAPPANSLKSALTVLDSEHSLSIGVVTVEKKDILRFWRPGEDRD
jgi:hypothetical protein